MRFLTTLAAGLAALVALAPSAAHATFAGKSGPIAYSYFPGEDNAGATDFEIVTVMPGRPPNFLLPQGPHKDNCRTGRPTERRWCSGAGCPRRAATSTSSG